MKSIQIDLERCVACGSCTAVCALQHLSHDPQGRPEILAGSTPCMDCGQCQAVCPAGAMELEYGQSAGSTQSGLVEDSRNPGFPDADAFGLGLKSRRSVRRFQDKPVDKDLITQVLEDCAWAPTARNCQSTQWAVIHNPAVVHGLGSRILTALSARPEYQARYRMVPHGSDVIFRGAPHLVIAHNAPEDRVWPADATIAVTWFDLAAQARGLGTCWSGLSISLPQAADALKAAAGIPTDHHIGGVLMLGWPDVEYRTIPARRQPRLTWV